MNDKSNESNEENWLLKAEELINSLNQDSLRLLTELIDSNANEVATTNNEVISTNNDTKVNILLAEYETLRNELCAIHNRIFNLVNLTIATIGLFILIVPQKIELHITPSFKELNLPYILLALFIIIVPFILISVFVNAQKGSKKITKRLRLIEKTINETVGEKIIYWETEHGWQSIFSDLRKKD